MGGPEAFDPVVNGLRGLPFVVTIEWALLFAPFLFHMFYGLWIIFTSKNNTVTQKHARNWAYAMQRITAMIVFVFILYHVISLRFGELHHMKDGYHAYLGERFARPEVYWWYMVGIAATCYHLANGVCTFAMTWGLTVGRNAQRATAAAMTAVGLVLFGIGVSAVNGFLPKDKPAVTAQAPGKPTSAAPFAVASQANVAASATTKN
jgi:succinate dehydrogenase / fumarate reductase cytochrome b subunit